MINHVEMKRLARTQVAIAVGVLVSGGVLAQDVWPPEQSGNVLAAQTSPFAPPDKDDVTFVVDDAPGLDTGCTFRSGGPLIFNVPITRHIGDRDKLLASGAIKPTATLRMPAFDVDYNGSPPPERNRVSINGHVVPGDFLTGENNVWKLNAFEIPVDWLEFPAAGDPKANPALNQIRVDIDTASSSERWCTAIDWAALSIKVTRPHLLVHGILSDATTWAGPWNAGLDSRGIPHDAIDLSPGSIALDSISDNAGDIAARVTQLKTKWGVDKLNIVSHSKGGLDSRHFAETHDSVNRLIQLGTPNAGSPLADYVQAGSIFFFGLGGTVLANVFAGPAGYQLTTSYMAGYNAFHGHNPNTTYVSLGGNYTGGGFVDGLLNFILPGPDDTVVPLSSVHALNYASHLTYSSSGANGQAKHTGQTKSQDIFNSLIGGTSQPVGADLVEVAQAEAAPAVAGLVFTAPAVGEVAQGETNTHSVAVDGTGPGAFSMFYGLGDLNLVLTSPSGVRIDSAVAASDATISFEANESIAGFKTEAYQFDNLEAGIWEVEITGASVTSPSGKEGYLVSAWMSNPSIEMSAVTRGSVMPAGQPIVIDATLTNGGAPLLGASVSADVMVPSGGIEMVVLRDDGHVPDAMAGDGVYSGASSVTSEGGIYNISVTAEGSNPAFSRQSLLVVSVSASQSSLTGAFADAGIDSNNNGLFDALGVDVELNIESSGNYMLAAELAASNGMVISNVLERRSLGTGIQNVRLAFSGEDIFSKGMDGPYTLKSVRLAEETPAGDVLPLDELTNAYTTAAYRVTDFERPAIVVVGTGTESAIDSNGNGLIDRLDILLDMQLRFTDSYQWTARLLDRNGTEVGFTSGSGFLNAGANAITLRFNGSPIGANGINGPYEVTDLLISSSGGQSAVVTAAYTTAAYLANEFEGFNGQQEGDLNGDGCIDRVDARLLLTQIRAGSTDPALDLNGDGSVNISDARKLTSLFTNTHGQSCQVIVP